MAPGNRRRRTESGLAPSDLALFLSSDAPLESFTRSKAKLESLRTELDRFIYTKTKRTVAVLARELAMDNDQKFLVVLNRFLERRKLLRSRALQKSRENLRLAASD